MTINVADEAKLTGRTTEEVQAHRTVLLQSFAWLKNTIEGLGQDPDRYTGPLFGTQEWLDLAPEDPKRTAGVLLATKSWLQDKADLPERVLAETFYLTELGAEYAEWAVDGANAIARRMAHDLARLPTYEELTVRREVFRTYGDVLGHDPDDPARNEIRATPGWTPVALPGRPGWWRHCAPDGQQIDLPSYEFTGPGSAA